MSESGNGNGSNGWIKGGVVTIVLAITGSIMNLYGDVRELKAMLPVKTADRYTASDAARDKAEIMRRLDSLERRK